MTSKLPDFITLGAMKAGTSTLHYALDRHPDVFIPQQEIGFFDIDEITQHGDFFVYTNGKWFTPKFEEEFDQFFEWYTGFFASAESHQTIGEDSTSYLSSEDAPGRIADCVPDVKLIVLLRDPVDRMYSHYWHLVNTGRTSLTFEQMIRRTPYSLFERSYYLEHLKRYREHFSENQLKVVLFETFVEDMSSTLKEIYDYIGVEDVDDEYLKPLEKNKTKIPRNTFLKRAVNGFFHDKSLTYYRNHLPYAPDYRESAVKKAIRKCLDKISSWPRREKPPMNPETEKFLRGYFRRRLEGLDDYVDGYLNEAWTWYN